MLNSNKVEQILLEHMLFGMFESILDPKYILGIYVYGSRSYGTSHEGSDLDYAVVIDSGAPIWKNGMKEYVQFESDDLDMHIMSDSHYKGLLEEHDIMALEMFFSENPIKKYEVDFTVNLQKLRKSVSSTASNSWVKAKKKITLENEDSKIGLKSFYHSFRIIDFGIQIAKYGKIENFEYAGGLNPVRDSNIENIINPKWEYWNDKLKPYYNSEMTEFRKHAPKEIK